MHQDILVQTEMPHIIPPENLILRQRIAVMDTFLMGRAHLLVDKIRYQHINLLTLIVKVAKQRQDSAQRLFVYPVVAVHHFKIFPPGSAKPLVDRISMAAVFFIYHPDNSGVFFHIFVGDFRRTIRRTVVYDENLDLIPARQDTFNRPLHIIL